MCTCSQGCVVNPISRNWVGYSSFDLRYRTGFSSAFGTSWGLHNPSSQNFTWDPTFHGQCGEIFKYLSSVAFSYSTRVIDWIGTAGVGGVCDDKPYHSTGRALDITNVSFSDGSRVDTRGSWEVADTGNRRLYCALVASCRIYFGTGGVLSAGYSGHSDHIHVDNWNGTSPPFSTGSGADRVILRRINRVFGGSGITVNSNAWSNADATATAATLSAFGLSCYNIFGNAWHMIGYMDMVAKHGMANKPAGYFNPNAC